MPGVCCHGNGADVSFNKQDPGVSSLAIPVPCSRGVICLRMGEESDSNLERESFMSRSAGWHGLGVSTRIFGKPMRDAVRNTER